MRRYLTALFLSAGTFAFSSLSAQTVVGLPQRSLPTVQATGTGEQISPNQAFDRRPAGAAPTVTATAASPSEIRVTWTAVPGVVGYLVRRNPATTPELLTPTAISATELVDKNLLPNTAASYEVWADFGPESPNSPGRSSTVTATTPPPVNPSGFTAHTLGSGAQFSSPPYGTHLQWTPAPGAAYYTVKSNGQLVYIGAASSTGLSVPLGEHYYDLLAYYGPTGAAIADTSAPVHAWGNAFPVPDLVATVTGPGMVTGSWGAVSGAARYIVTRQRIDLQAGTLGPEVFPNGPPPPYGVLTSFNDTNVPRGTYRYNAIAQFDIIRSDRISHEYAYAHVTVTIP